ncbi:SNF1-related protein kinase regulatory subunit beta-2 [Nymphaea thermarum]|nr:SNF1-related protein kinase regulatory subunit beta-2 [Nymphaea thermarum]
MGNASVREDGGSSHGVGPAEGEMDDGQEQQGEVASPGSSELMGQSPPHSPGAAARSPLMFTPQVPLVPLQRPDEMYSPTAWAHGYSAYEDYCYDQGIPTMFTWSYGGKEVAVEGSWDNWRSKKLLQRSGKDFTLMKVLPSGVYQYRYIVDGERRYNPDLPCGLDHMGNACNVLDVQEYVPEQLESLAGFEPPQSPESSYGNLNLSPEDFSKEPHLAPPHLHLTLLNVPSCSDSITSPTSRPQHVVLNHLYVQKGKAGQSVVALGVTHRFLAKYVTVVLYKSLQR